jgi:hypothetical protein
MTYAGTNGTSLAELQAPRRNRYFYGKLLDVLHLTMEQQYAISATAHVNRLNFGPGVFCGLGVTPINRDDGHGVRVEAGVVFDAVGRRVVVPDAVELLPLQLTDDCGLPAQPQPDELSGSLVLSICYRECEADFAPALVPDPGCNGSTRCEAGTWVESYSLIVRKGDVPDPVTHACRKEVMERLKARDAQGALCILAEDCPPVLGDICVPLAAIEVADNGAVSVPEPCPVRPIVPTNRALLELIVCLAQRVEECCGDHPAPPAATLKVENLTVANRAGNDYYKLTDFPPNDFPDGMVVPLTSEPATVMISFVPAKLDESSVVLGTNVVIEDEQGVEPSFKAPALSSDQIKLELTDGVFRGRYTVTVSGDPPSPVKSTEGVALDATFSVKFTVPEPD